MEELRDRFESWLVGNGHRVYIFINPLPEKGREDRNKRFDMEMAEFKSAADVMEINAVDAVNSEVLITHEPVDLQKLLIT